MPYNNGSGSTAGAAITTANSGGASGDAFQAVSSVAPLWASTQTGPYSGIGRPMQFNASSSAQYVQVTSGFGATSDTTYLSFYFYASSITATTSLATLLSSTSGVQLVRVAVDTARHIRIFGFSNASLYTGVAGAEIPLNQWVFVSLMTETLASARVRLTVQTMDGSVVENVSLTGVATGGPSYLSTGAVRMGSDTVSGAYSQYFLYEPRMEEHSAWLPNEMLAMPPKLSAELPLFDRVGAFNEDELYTTLAAFMPGTWTPTSQMLSPSNGTVTGVFPASTLFTPEMTDVSGVMVILLTGDLIFLDDLGVGNMHVERWNEAGTVQRSVGQEYTTYDGDPDPATSAVMYVMPFSQAEGGQMVKLIGSGFTGSGDGDGTKVSVLFIYNVNPGSQPLMVFRSYADNTTGPVQPLQRSGSEEFPEVWERELYSTATVVVTEVQAGTTPPGDYWDVLRPYMAAGTEATHVHTNNSYSLAAATNMKSWQDGTSEVWYSTRQRNSWAMWEIMIPIQGVLKGVLPYTVNLVGRSQIGGVQALPFTVGLQAAVKQEFSATGSTSLTVGLTGASTPQQTATSTLALTVGLVGTAKAVSSLPLTVGLVGTVRITAQLPIVLGLSGRNTPTQVQAILPISLGLKTRLAPPPVADPLEDITLSPLDFDVTLAPIQDYEVV